MDRDSGFVVHRLVSIYSQKMQRHYVTRGDAVRVRINQSLLIRSWVRW